MECRCDKDNFDNAVSGWWPNSNGIQMGALTVVGYLLYRFSQTLPALIRWPIRLFCSLTGLTALWGWVGRLLGTVRGIQNLFNLVSRLWRFIIAFSSKCKWLVEVIKTLTGNQTVELDKDQTSNSPTKAALRFILLGPTGGGRTSLAERLLGNSEKEVPKNQLMQSSKRRTLVDGREVTVVDTPDLLGSSLGIKSRAREALRSLQLASPGPHAFLVVIKAPGSSRIDQDLTQAIGATVELFGEGAMEFILPVLTHADRLSPACTVDQLLDVGSGGLKRAVLLCGQRPELVDNRAGRPLEAQRELREQLVERVIDMKKLRGHFIHELQSRENHIREELLADMSSALAQKLEHMKGC
ncbi:GTPase IMAP family member 9-like [Betta splendens]|uniref:GTPase IMAP family member 9-like n=1 Tax=Betta splendens TaxID=158456 RepID=A0A9W2XER1_BETSP|nr:GTPase IMAP family member 9-like [Betta splendens]XP_055360161.1 GTPase IMAP family member 9-like [Betta splendens]